MKSWNMLPSGEKFAASFSGGKDSALAIYKADQAGQVLGLVSMFNEDGRSGAHGLSEHFIRKQAEAMGLPIRFGHASWEGYEEVFTGLLREYKALGAEALLTGDLDVPEENCWHERVSGNADLDFYAPLWQMNHVEEAREFVRQGFSAVVVCVNTKTGMTKADLGRVFDGAYVEELLARGIDPSAEAGEFHTAVVDGPSFHASVPYRAGKIRALKEYFQLELI
ncbi:MAG TPA: diphthine--ammonia ligase [Oscillospiraceae bacterium]|nr:diphthine--ammonia ligase [Oscillospiraceae bacterium]